MVTTNTFGSNARKLAGRATVAEAYRAAAECARTAGARYVAGDIGPTGALLEPWGALSFEEAYALFAEQVRAAADAGCDLIVVETMSDLREAKAAVLAAKENCALPVFATMTFGEDGRTFLGTTPEIAAVTLSSLGAHAVGVNCSLGPDELVPVAEALARFARCPVIVRPNAGLPRIEGGRTVYDVGPDEFARAMERVMAHGASVLGGCCGTTPAHIERLAALAAGRTPVPRACRPAFVVTSAQKAVVMPEGERGFALIGERINPTGKKRLKQALREGDFDYLVGEAAAQQEAGADVLDVNVGLPELDEPATLRAAVEALQAAGTLPLQVDSSDPAAIEAAVRGYAGKPLVNSVSGEQESLRAVLPVVKRYGCAVVGLTLDEDGIPPTAEGRFALAERIVEAAEACAASPAAMWPSTAWSWRRPRTRTKCRRYCVPRDDGEGAPGRAHGAGRVQREFRPARARCRERHVPGRCPGCGARSAHHEPAFGPLPRRGGRLPRAGRPGPGRGRLRGDVRAGRGSLPGRRARRRAKWRRRWARRHGGWRRGGNAGPWRRCPWRGERRADARAAATASQVAVTPALADAVEDVRALVRSDPDRPQRAHGRGHARAARRSRRPRRGERRVRSCP